jgi:hypothetical protein
MEEMPDPLIPRSPFPHLTVLFHERGARILSPGSRLCLGRLSRHRGTSPGREGPSFQASPSWKGQVTTAFRNLQNAKRNMITAKSTSTRNAKSSCMGVVVYWIPMDWKLLPIAKYRIPVTR